jgi:hypothetical protein
MVKRVRDVIKRVRTSPKLRIRDIMASYVLYPLVWISGIGLVVSGGVWSQEIGSAWGAVLFTLGGTVLSAVMVGTLLNAIWWQKWTKKALATLFQDPDMIGALGLDRVSLKERLLKVICAIYGAQEPSLRLKRLLRRDILNRLARPIRLNYHISHRVGILDSPEYDLVLLTRFIRYQNYYATEEARQTPLFPNEIILQGYIDIPEVLLSVWRSHLATTKDVKEESDEAREQLEKLVLKEVPLIRLGKFFIAGEECSDTDIRLDCQIDGAKPEPSIAYKVKYKGNPIKLLPTGERIQVSYSYSQVHNMFSYSYIALAGLTDGMTAHLSYDRRRLKANLRYILPFYWGKEEKLLSQPQEGEIDLTVNAMLLAGHGIFCSWYPQDVKLSKLKADGWLKREGVIA